MTLSIVIATFNRKNYLFSLLKQIRQQANHPYLVKIIVIDDGSCDGTSIELKSDFPEVILIFGTGHWWWTKCMNEGFKKALEINSDYILVMNDDVEIQSHYLKVLAEDYSMIPFNSILGSMSISIESPGLIEMSGTKSFNRFWLKEKQYKTLYTKDSGENKILPSHSLCGRGTLIPASVFSKIGFYDEYLVQYGSDDEFIWRAKKHGIDAFISWNLKVFNHTYLTSSSSSVKKTSLLSFTKNLFNKHSATSLKKHIYLYNRYGHPFFLPVYLVYTILGVYKAYFFNFRKLKK